MKQVSHRGYLLVEVPEMEEYGCEIRGRIGKNHLLSFYGNADAIELPPGQWEIIGKGNEIREPQWKEIVEHKFNHTMYENYLLGRKAFFETATQSGHTLIKYHGMKPDTTLILKLKTNA